MKQDTVMQTGDKTKYKHVFVCGVAQSGTSLLGRNIARLENCTGFKNTGASSDEGEFLQDVYSIALASSTNEVVASTVIEWRRRCRWRRRSRFWRLKI